MADRVQYLCNQCKISQIIEFTDEMIEQYITKDPNGLSLYSHVHLCENGLAGVNNLFIDHNLDVRSYSFVELPQYKRELKMVIPGTPKIKNEKKTVRVTQISYKNDLNLRIEFETAKFDIKVGSFSPLKSNLQSILVSPFNLVKLYYYESNLKFTPQLEQWLKALIENLEILVPGKLGLIIEIFQLIVQDKDKYPSDLDKNIIKTILVSHDIFFELNRELDISQLFYAYGEENGILMLGIVKMIENNPMVNLHEMVLNFKKNVVTIMFVLLILEVHGVVTIYRPGIMSSDVDMASLL